ncbi:MAG TPA: 4-hydroxyphenylpyruvate dioxygenase [Nostocaceae cyanobacterium]|nr:4-hydroxyphenylpyruvate dioxygenase [Nostocaceae cyanobacterium]
MIQIDHVHFYVEDAQRWRDWFVNCLGFEVVTGAIFPQLFLNQNALHTCTEVVKSGAIYFLLSSPLLPTSPVAEFLRQHPPGVVDVAFAAANVEELTIKARVNGANILQPVQTNFDLKYSQIAAWGLTHTLIERMVIDSEISATNGQIFTAIDHVVLNVGAGDLELAVSWYEKIFDFRPQQSFNIQTDRSALFSQVLISRDGNVQLPINQPASPNSQIQEFLEVNRGSGIQHIALKTANLVEAIARLRAAGLSFLSTPPSYYSQLQQRPGLPLSLAELEAIAQQEILVDWQDQAPLGALLLQIFTQPIFSQPTFFFEFIERRAQATGFGEGNFRALFTAMETEQIKRGIGQEA